MFLSKIIRIELLYNMVTQKQAIVKASGVSGVLLAKELKITVGELQTIQNTIAKGASIDELKLFLFQAKRTGLDPFSRQIHLVKRGDTAVIQTGIDGYRAVAERTGKYAGNDEPVFETNPAGKPIKASVTVWKIVAKQRVAFTASARWEEYFPGDKLGFMWKSKPFLMLSKCAEALALRKAFPADLSGLYVQEELQKEEKLSGDIADEKPPYREVVMTAIKFAETCNEATTDSLRVKIIEHNFSVEEAKAVNDILEERFPKEAPIVPENNEPTEEEKAQILKDEQEGN